MDDVTIDRGFTEDERDRVAALYWEAFGRKLRPGFVDESTGLSVVRGALRPDHLLVARRGGDVLGVCGFHADATGVADLSWSRLRRTLSVPAALRASLVLSVLARSADPDALVLDGVCVDRASRGTGTGTALLGAAADRARRVGARVVRLSVVDGNPRARALYERRGFVPVGRGALGPLAAVYGFDGYTTMEQEVGR
jgi:GNAT superfamily N-acetyltransferase